MSLIFTNINSIAGGRFNFWENSKDRDVALVDAVGKPIDQNQIKLKDTSSPDDDILEL